ncbi:MAG: heterodisulfide reductase-related iron-sulfur binding cluster, partial [Aquificaceae bacterium]
KLSKEELALPLELCFHCKQCYFKCPYTPPHEWRIDFPHLSLRYKVWKFKNKGAKITDKIMLNTDLVGKLSVPFSPIVNRLNQVPAFRVIMEGVMGIDRRAKLPPINSETFVSWFKKNYKPPKEPKGKVALFYTCLLNYNYLERGKALIKVFEKNEIYVELPEQQCCGIPFFDIGDIDSSTQRARYNIKRLRDYVKAGFDIVVPVPTCALQIKYEYPLLLPDDPEAKLVAERVYDVHEYLFRLHQEKKFNRDFKVSLGSIAYHIPCHLKSLNVGYRAVALMRLIPNTRVQIIERCSGHDGTFGVRKETFDMSVRVGSKLFEDLKNSNADLFVSDCPLSGNHIEMATGKRVYHPIEVLAMAYGED